MAATGRGKTEEDEQVGGSSDRKRKRGKSAESNLSGGERRGIWRKEGMERGEKASATVQRTNGGGYIIVTFFLFRLFSLARGPLWLCAKKKCGDTCSAGAGKYELQARGHISSPPSPFHFRAILKGPSFCPSFFPRPIYSSFLISYPSLPSSSAAVSSRLTDEGDRRRRRGEDGGSTDGVIPWGRRRRGIKRERNGFRAERKKRKARV